MSGKVVDLSSDESSLPDEFVLDTSILIAQFLGAAVQDRRGQIERAARVFEPVLAGTSTAFVAFQSMIELFHKYIVIRYEQELGSDRERYRSLVKGRLSWRSLYKIRDGLMREYCDELADIHLAIVASNVMVLQPFDLGSSMSSLTQDVQLLQLMRKFRLDSADAAILLDADRAGISGVVTTDRDFRRASKNFDIYTWLA